MVLGEIEQGITDRCLLPWVPLMAGGGSRAAIERWKAIASAETDDDRRETYAHLALVFAELTPSLVDWQRSLEGWAMRESQVVNSIKRDALIEGEIRAMRRATLDALRIRLTNPVPDAVRLAVEGTNDPETLNRWFGTALKVNTIQEFAAAIVSSS